MKSKFTFFLCLFGLLSLNVCAQNVGYVPVNENDYALYPKAPMLDASDGQGSTDAYDLSGYMPPVGNQGTLNTSATYSACYAIKSFQEMIEDNATSYLMNDRIDGNRVFSPAFLQNTLTDGNPERPVSLVEVLNGMKDVGCVRWNDFPTYWEKDKEWNYNASKPSHSLKRRASKYKIKDWYSLGVRNNINIMEVKSYLRYNYPVLLGLNIDDGFMRLNASYPVWDHTIGNVYGSHSMVIVGFDDNFEVNQVERGAFKVLNSWGAEWGMGGYCWISYNHFRNVAVEAYIMEDEINQDYISYQNNNNYNNGGTTINVYETYYNNQVVLYPIYVHVHYGYFNHYPVFYQSYCPVFQNNYYSGYCNGNYNTYNSYYQYNNYGGGYCYYNNVIVVNNTTINNTTINNTTINNNNHNDYTHTNTNQNVGTFIKNGDLSPQHPTVLDAAPSTTPKNVTSVSQVVPPKKPRSIVDIPKATASTTNPNNVNETATPKTSTFSTNPRNNAEVTPKTATIPATPKATTVNTETPKTSTFSTNPRNNAEVTPKTATIPATPKANTVNTETPKTSTFSTNPRNNAEVTPKTATIPATPKANTVNTEAPKTSTFSTNPRSNVETTPKTAIIPATPRVSNENNHFATPKPNVETKPATVAPFTKPSHAVESAPKTQQYTQPEKPKEYSAPTQSIRHNEEPKKSYSAPVERSEPSHYEAPKHKEPEPVRHYEAPAPVRHEAPARHETPAPVHKQESSEPKKSLNSGDSNHSFKKGH